jgi:hypothetical protein
MQTAREPNTFAVRKARKILLPGLSGYVSDLSYDNVCNPNGYGEYNSHWMEFDIAKAGKLNFHYNAYRRMAGHGLCCL